MALPLCDYLVNDEPLDMDMVYGAVDKVKSLRKKEDSPELQLVHEILHCLTQLSEVGESTVEFTLC